MPRPVRRPPPRRPLSDEAAARLRMVRKWGIHAAAGLAFIGLIALAVAKLQLSLAANAGGEPPKIVFANRPAWMSDLLAADLAASFRPDRPLSVFDRHALVAVHERLAANPWVQKIGHVRRLYGQSAGDAIEIDCTFRRPTALVYDHNSRYWFVDEKGFMLPEWFSEKELPQLIGGDGKITLRVIEGVRNPPPTNAGELWPGDDLIAGLDLAGTLADQPFSQDIAGIDVSNYGGRVNLREPQLVLRTCYDTLILWGRPVKAVDAFIENWPDKKLAVLQRLYEDYGRVDAGSQWVDIRFPEQTLVPSPTSDEGGHADGR